VNGARQRSRIELMRNLLFPLGGRGIEHAGAAREATRAIREMRLLAGRDRGPPRLPWSRGPSGPVNRRRSVPGAQGGSHERASRFLVALGAATGFRAEGGKLLLLDEGGRVRVRLTALTR